MQMLKLNYLESRIMGPPVVQRSHELGLSMSTGLPSPPHLPPPPLILGTT